jgi:16S rRNA (cytosine1402-N4)-methyltransferase
MTGMQPGAGAVYHVPVMVQEVLQWLLTAEVGIYVDGTLGGGGHTAALLERLAPSAQVIGIDADPEALEYCRQRFAQEIAQGRLRLVQGNFRKVCVLLADVVGKVQGFLLESSRRSFAATARSPAQGRSPAGLSSAGASPRCGPRPTCARWWRRSSLLPTAVRR